MSLASVHSHRHTIETYGQRLLPRLIDEKAMKLQDQLVGMMAVSENITDGFDFISYSQLSNAADFTAHWLDKNLSTYSSGKTSSNICFIGIQDFRYWVMEIAAIKTRYPLLIPNIRNATANTVSLLRACDCTTLFYSRPLAAQARALADAMPGLSTIPIPELSEMVSERTSHYPYTKTWDEAKYDTLLIVHTSGSTGAPKPIYYNHIHLNRPDMDNVVPSVAGRKNASLSLLGKNKLTYFGGPFFHLSGIAVSIGVFLAESIAVIGPPLVVSTGRIAADIISAVPIHGLIMVPSLCEQVFMDHGEEVLPFLNGLSHVCWLGGKHIYPSAPYEALPLRTYANSSYPSQKGPLNQATGDFITTRTKADLWQIIGSTETHLYPLLLPPAAHWKYLDFHPTCGPTVELVPGALAADGSQLYEIVQNRKTDMDAGRAFQPVFDIFPDLFQWRSRDLVKKIEVDGVDRPLFDFQGRIDDLLILSSGLKINPLHMETEVSSRHPFLSGSLVFGAGRRECGLLLEVKKADRDGMTSGRRKELLEEVWLSVEIANRALPEHARVKEGMILVTSVEKPFLRAGKGTVIRRLTCDLYAEEIERLYVERVVNTAQ